MKKLTMNDKWEIHKKLEEANCIITKKLYSLENVDEKIELLSYQIEIEKIIHKLAN
ncbi:hypothetical protein NUG13_11975 [Bacillus subtilis]|uniref:hypothetical protein n=1 Tax=Bacillus subtilis group TaxID=653685 RepID=UPI00200FE737|nr:MULTISPECIES: hypothetical protein [Bacillus subtilis group]MCR4362046.1 hypothetical protein [Bacillus subtilis]UQB84338.1 hypothetical protein KMZ31_19655 [Bacillus amyloliquefaciens]